MGRSAGPLIALLTDFGLEDPFVGVMKGVLLSRCPEARVVDVTHGVPPQDVRRGAFHLMSAVPYFPDGTLFVCVVDPGVGSPRRALWARSARHQFLGPDNGMLSWAERAGRFLEAREVTRRALFLEPVSATFHGRDVFAPVAAALASGVPPGRLGPRARGWTRLPFPEPERRGPRWRGEVLTVDRVGDAVTNLPARGLPAGTRFSCRGARIRGLSPSYAAVRTGRDAAVAGSWGFVELAVRDGSFAARRRARPGDPVEARLPGGRTLRRDR